jgi:hypothetical protein
VGHLAPRQDFASRWLRSKIHSGRSRVVDKRTTTINYSEADHAIRIAVVLCLMIPSLSAVISLQ